MDRKTETELARLEQLAHGLENLIGIPGTDIRLGIDAILGFFPVVGDVVPLVPASYIIARAHRHGVPRRQLIRMGMNVALDVLIGLVPLLGDIFDIGWKANTRNVALLRQHLESQTARAGMAQAAEFASAERV